MLLWSRRSFLSLLSSSIVLQMVFFLLFPLPLPQAEAQLLSPILSIIGGLFPSATSVPTPSSAGSPPVTSLIPTDSPSGSALATPSLPSILIPSLPSLIPSFPSLSIPSLIPSFPSVTIPSLIPSLPSVNIFSAPVATPISSLSALPSFRPTSSTSFPFIQTPSASPSKEVEATPTPKGNTPISTPTPTPAEQSNDPDGNPVNICTNPAFPYGCNGTCVNSLSLCNGGEDVCLDPEVEGCDGQDEYPGDKDPGVIPIDVTIPENGTVIIPVVGKDGSFIGELEIPAEAFRKGTVVRVQSFNGEPPEEETDGCGSEEKSRVRVAGLFEITAIGPNGEKRELKRPVRLTFLAVLPEGETPEGACVVFNHGAKGSRWNCERNDLEYKRLNYNGTRKNTFLITQEFSHFTGFSVLMGDTEGAGGEGCFSTIHWLTVGFLAGTGVLVTIICFTYYLRSLQRIKQQNKKLSVLGRKSSISHPHQLSV